MNVELIPVAIAGYLIYKGLGKYMDSADDTDASDGAAAAETFESEYSLEYINPNRLIDPFALVHLMHMAEALVQS